MKLASSVMAQLVVVRHIMKKVWVLNVVFFFLLLSECTPSKLFCFMLYFELYVLS